MGERLNENIALPVGSIALQEIGRYRRQLGLNNVDVVKCAESFC
jgi:hypothetical protein